MFKLYFSSSGRINRKLFVWNWLFLTAAQILISYLVEHPLASFLVILPGAYCMAVLSIKRFHDLNKSAWNYLFLLIPIVSFYFYALLLFKKGIVGDNPYGQDPLVAQKQSDVSSGPTDNPNPITPNKDMVSNSANRNPVYSTSSSGFGKKLILGLGALLVTGAIISYVKNSDSSHQDLQRKLSKQSSDANRELSSSQENTKLEQKVVNDPPSQFIFQVLNINNDEVTVQFEKNVPMNIKFFGVSKDLLRRAEILSRESQKQAVIYLDSASLLKIGNRYYGYLNSLSEESAHSPEDWL